MIKPLEFLAGRKTYIVAILSAVYGAGIQAGFWPDVPLVTYLLLGGGLAALRSGISSEVAAVPPPPPSIQPPTPGVSI